MELHAHTLAGNYVWGWLAFYALIALASIKVKTAAAPQLRSSVFLLL